MIIIDLIDEDINQTEKLTHARQEFEGNAERTRPRDWVLPVYQILSEMLQAAYAAGMEIVGRTDSTN